MIQFAQKILHTSLHRAIMIQSYDRNIISYHFCLTIPRLHASPLIKAKNISQPPPENFAILFIQLCFSKPWFFLNDANHYRPLKICIKLKVFFHCAPQCAAMKRFIAFTCALRRLKMKLFQTIDSKLSFKPSCVNLTLLVLASESKRLDPSLQTSPKFSGFLNGNRVKLQIWC